MVDYAARVARKILTSLLILLSSSLCATSSPDPFSASAKLSDPQSLNRYSYVQNQPTISTEPSGLPWRQHLSMLIRDDSNLPTSLKSAQLKRASDTLV